MITEVEWTGEEAEERRVTGGGGGGSVETTQGSMLRTDMLGCFLCSLKVFLQYSVAFPFKGLGPPWRGLLGSCV